MVSRSTLKLHKMTFLILVTVAAITLSLVAVPASSVSTNPCSSFHGGLYYQQLDILEGNSQNIFPSSIQMGETQTVRVIISNINNAPRNNVFSSVTVSLASQNDHFVVQNPNFDVGTLPTGTASATWQIIGTSEGPDALMITASATNTHENLRFQDSYFPNPQITVAFNPNYTPMPTPSPTPIPTLSPVPTPTPIPSPIPNTTTGGTTNPTLPPTPTPSSSNQPTISPSSNPTTTQTPNPTQTPISINSPLLYFHPSLAIAGYVFIFLFTALMVKGNLKAKTTKITGALAWLFALLGLVSGLLLAQVVLGSYWSWDPKEILTLVMFLAVSAGQLLYFEKKYSAAKWLALLACALVVITGLSSLIINVLL